MKKTTSAFISGFSAVLLCALIGPFMLTACKGAGETQPDASATTAILDTFPAQLTDSADLAFTATCENGGPFDWGYDYWTKRSYFVYYNGTIEIKTSYSLSGESQETRNISYSDLKKIRNLADSFRDKRAEYDLTFSGSRDLDNWSFYTYDTNGSRTFVYGGFIKGVTELESIDNTLAVYNSMESLDDRAYAAFEGTYVCPDDDDLYVSLYKEGKQIYLEIGSDDVYEINKITLKEDSVTFSSGSDDLAFSYSSTKTEIQDLENSVTYVKQSADAGDQGDSE